jgi:tetratricopeptide (TPR) repeat protein
VLSEEALLIIAAFVGIGLLILGVLELLSPTRPRHPVRGRPRARSPRAERARPAPLPASQPRAGAEREPVAAAALVPSPFEGPIGGLGEVRIAAPMDRPAAGPAAIPMTADTDAAAGSATDIPIASAAAVPTAPAVEVPVTSAAEVPIAGLADVPMDPLPSIATPAGVSIASEEVSAPGPAVHGFGEPGPADRCAALLEAGHVDEAIECAEAALRQLDADGAPGATRARLWGWLGRARRARGDADGARAALESAIAAAYGTERGEWERELVVLALATARSLVARTEEDPTGEGAIADVRGALSWLETGVARAPGERMIEDTLAAVRDALWAIYAGVATGLIQRGDFLAARRYVTEALADEALPRERRPPFVDLLATTHGAEAAQLTEDALHAMKDGRDDEALGLLARGEDMVALVPADGSNARARRELERRLWWGYMRIGTRRLARGAAADALEALFRALGLGGVGPERLAETRATIGRAFHQASEASRGQVERLLERGERAAAVAEAGRLAALLRRSADHGLGPDDLGDVVARVEDLRGRIERGA